MRACLAASPSTGTAANSTGMASSTRLLPAERGGPLPQGAAVGVR